MNTRANRLCAILLIMLVCLSFQCSYAIGFFGIFSTESKGPKPGERVTISAPDRSDEGLLFDHWEVLTPNTYLEDAYSQTTSFVVPNGVSEIDVRPIYKTITTPTPTPKITHLPTPETTPTPKITPTPTIKASPTTAPIPTLTPTVLPKTTLHGSGPSGEWYFNKPYDKDWKSVYIIVAADEAVLRDFQSYADGAMKPCYDSLGIRMNYCLFMIGANNESFREEEVLEVIRDNRTSYEIFFVYGLNPNAMPMTKEFCESNSIPIEIDDRMWNGIYFGEAVRNVVGGL